MVPRGQPGQLELVGRDGSWSSEDAFLQVYANQRTWVPLSLAGVLTWASTPGTGRSELVVGAARVDGG
jgi:hypothetical protein